MEDEKEKEVRKIISDFFVKIDPGSVLAEIRHQKEGKIINIQVDEPARLIGKEGKTLQSIQLLINVILRKKLDLDESVIIDINGYKEKRFAMLNNWAIAAAQKAKKTGKVQQLPLLNPYERRIIHLTLMSESGVKTKSIGRGDERRIMVIPQGKI